MMEKIKNVLFYVFLPITGIFLIYKMFFASNKDTLKKALIADQGKAAEATTNAALGQNAKEQASKIEEQVQQIKVEEDWHTKRNKF